MAEKTVFGVTFNESALEVVVLDFIAFDPLCRYVKRLEKRFGPCTVAFVARSPKRGHLTARIHSASGYRNIKFETSWRKTSGSF